MRWYVNDASIQNQFDGDEFVNLLDSLGELTGLCTKYDILKENLYLTQSLF